MLGGVRHRALLQRLPAEELGSPILGRKHTFFFFFSGKPSLKASTVLFWFASPVLPNQQNRHVASEPSAGCRLDQQFHF